VRISETLERRRRTLARDRTRWSRLALVSAQTRSWSLGYRLRQAGAASDACNAGL